MENRMSISKGFAIQETRKARIKNSLDYYLWDLDANNEERRCARMWVRDGHWITQNDHHMTWSNDEPWDFLTASREVSCPWREYTDSFYDEKTQIYIRRNNLTPYQMRKLREYRRSGGRFCDEWMAAYGAGNYIEYLREYKEAIIGMFSSEFDPEICRYGAEFIARRNLAGAFVDFVQEKEKSNQDPPSFEEQLPGYDLPF